MSENNTFFGLLSYFLDLKVTYANALWIWKAKASAPAIEAISLVKYLNSDQWAYAFPVARLLIKM
jgi:hypothetical protein